MQEQLSDKQFFISLAFVGQFECPTKAQMLFQKNPHWHNLLFYISWHSLELTAAYAPHYRNYVHMHFRKNMLGRKALMPRLYFHYHKRQNVYWTHLQNVHSDCCHTACAIGN